MRMGVAKPHGSAVGGQKDSHYKLGNGEPPRSGFVQLTIDGSQIGMSREKIGVTRKDSLQDGNRFLIPPGQVIGLNPRIRE